MAVADVEGEDSRIIDEDTESLFAAYHKEVVSAVEGTSVLQMFRFVGAFALVNPAALVDTADIFAQAIDLVVVVHGIGEGTGSFIHSQERKSAVFSSGFLKNGLGLDDMAVGKS